MFLDVFDQIGNRVNGECGIDDKNERRLQVKRDGDEVLQRIIGRFFKEAGPDCHDGAGRGGQRVAVGRGIQDGLDSDKAGAARLILDDHRFAQRLAELLGIKTRDDVHACSRRQRDKE